MSGPAVKRRDRPTRRRIVGVASGALALLVAVAILPAGYLAFVRPAPHSPADGCPDTRPVLVAAGASITQGTLGGDWVGTVRANQSTHAVVNAGVNGDTSAGLRDRLDPIVDCQPAAVVVLIGTNDARDGVPVAEYRANLVSIVDRLARDTEARIALASLPPLGEDLTAAPNQNLAAYNTAVREVAEAQGVDHLPVYDRMADQLTGERPPYDFSFGLALWAAVQHYTFQQSWDDIATRGDRTLLIDHVHLSDRGAKVVSDLVTAWLAG